jgi:predicted RNA-binding Zn-ribbon protein involved in translation (DUF1610 family)
MAKPIVDGNKLKQAILKFGSLEKSVTALQKEGQLLLTQNNELKQKVAKLRLESDNLIAENLDMKNKLDQQKKQLQLQAELIEQSKRQYQLFEGFLAMVVGSPSVTKPIEDLIVTLKTLLDSGWHTSHKADDLRSLFIRTVMGDYLKCFRCLNCGASFMVNNEPHYKYFSNYYECPACHFHHKVIADDSFLKAMVSESQMENVRRVEEFQKENDTLKPFKLFSDLPCEVCKQPVTEWAVQYNRQNL